MMQQEFKMNNEKKVYRKPVMEVVEMDYGSSILEASCCTDTADEESFGSEYQDE